MSRRKDPALRQNRVTKDLVVPDIAVATPPLPVHPLEGEWGPAAEGRWVTMWASQVAPVFADSDAPIMVRLLQLEDEAALAAKLVAAAPMVEGSTGQLRTNPMAKQLKDLRIEIRNCEDRLGLSPKGRLSLGLTIAKAGAYGAATSLAQHNANFVAKQATIPQRRHPKLRPPKYSQADPEAPSIATADALPSVEPFFYID